MKKNKIILLLLVCSLFAPASILAIPASKGIEHKSMELTIEPKMIPYKELDSAIKKTVEQAINHYADGKRVKLETAIKMEIFRGKNKAEGWRIENKDRSAVINVDAASGKVIDLSLLLTMSEMKGKYKKQLEAANAVVKQVKAEAVFTGERVDFSINEWRNRQSITFITKDEQSIELDLKTCKPSYYSFKFKASNVDGKIMRTAEQAVKCLRDGKFASFTYIRRNSQSKGVVDIWEFKRKVEIKRADIAKYEHVEIGENGNKAYAIESQVYIDGKTGKLFSADVSPKTHNQKQVQLTQEQAVEIAIPAAQKMFGKDLSTYKVKVSSSKKVYTFSSKGEESILARFDKYGNLISMQRLV
ncbi:hypothetical protein [Paenibacillus agilis]|uniref:PepSY domain-containing protein n=1 Tax=Paenibacillus agilis TaxID=3020863 RepID=A0A559IVS4_9BACL|nr:hypothetical protein [Paenibacillus agilis]TVX91686.1 hypothetical protein FPZ44_00610 [Paenibacillus agilis]